jgi:hypothetical protein
MSGEPAEHDLNGSRVCTDCLLAANKEIPELTDTTSDWERRITAADWHDVPPGFYAIEVAERLRALPHAGPQAV